MTVTITDALLPLAAEPGRCDIVVDEGRIVSVAPAGSAGADGETFDAAGRALIPGLIETHMHLTGADDLVALTDAGVTTAIDLGTHPDSLVDELRTQPGLCEIRSAGSAASAPGSPQSTLMGFPADSVVRGADDAQRYLDWRVSAGSDLIKIIVEDPNVPGVHALEPATLAALVRAAHARGLLTVAHVVTAHAFDLGLDAGVDVLTHAPIDRPLTPETVARMVEAGTIASPTLVMMRGVCAARAGQPGPPLSLEHAIESVRRMHAAGVPIVAGTDANSHPGSPSPVPHGTSLGDELGLLVEAGLSAREAVEAATVGAARTFRLDDRGRIEPGARADLLLLEGDPTQDVGHARRPAAVWIAGEQVR